MGLFGPEKITLTLEKYNYKPGDVIKGTVSLKLKKPTKARKLEVAFIGIKIEKETDTEYSSEMGPPRTTTEIVRREIYNSRLQLDGEKEYLEAIYPFEIKIPEDLVKFISASTEPGHNYKNYLKNAGINPDGKVGKALVFLKNHEAPFAHPLIEWHVETKLDIPIRTDIKKSQRIILTNQ